MNKVGSGLRGQNHWIENQFVKEGGGGGTPLHVLVLLPGTSLLILPASDDVSSPQGIPSESPRPHHSIITPCSFLLKH